MWNQKATTILQIAAVVIVSLVLAGSAAAQGLVTSSTEFPVKGGKYVSTNSATFSTGKYDVEIVSMSLSCRDPGGTIGLGGSSGEYSVESFFDVFVELSVDGGQSFVESFFDVFTELKADVPVDYAATGSFQAEIVEMTLLGELSGMPIIIREDPRKPSIGRQTNTDRGEGQFTVESFFDVFTELSVDGGQTWIAASNNIRMQLAPEPLPEPPLVFDDDRFPARGSGYESVNSVRYVGSVIETELVSLSLRGADPVNPISVMSLGGGGQYHIDSFFDVFTELSVGGTQFPVESFFDVFVEVTVDGGATDQTTGSWDAEIVSMSLSGDVGGTPVVIRENPSIASKGRMTVTDLGNGRFSVESFFDVFTELSVDGGENWVAGDGPIRVELAPEPPREPTLVAGINIDLHMDIPDAVANDFHVEGRIKSSQPPVLVEHVDGWFPDFDITIVRDDKDLSGKWYIVKADWSGADYKHCDILHVGLFFDVVCHNVIVDLVGWWTRDGVRLPGANAGEVPIPGFRVQDTPSSDMAAAGQTFELHNDSKSISIEIVQMDLATVESREELERLLGSEPFRELNTNGRQNRLPWVPVMTQLQLPVRLSPGGMHLVQLERFGISIPPGGFLIARELIQFQNNDLQTERRWAWEVHEAHRAELGDAPDSTNTHGAPMTTYGGVNAGFPSVYTAGSPPYGPKHCRPRAVAFLGPRVSVEMEADIGIDADAINNIHPPTNVADKDGFDDGVVTPLTLPHCGKSAFPYIVNVINPNLDLYVNVWFDFDRDGDWDDTHLCNNRPVPEWAVQNQRLPAGSLIVGLNNVMTPRFLSWHPPGSAVQEIWMRITISEQRWPFTGGAPASGYGGAGPPSGYKFGETEDYYFVPDTQPPQSDLGDAPDSTNSYAVPMTAYPASGPPGILAKYPSVFQAGSPPCGPRHLQPLAVAYLGESVSREVEADTALDADGFNNIYPPNDVPDRDAHDDGLLNLPLHLPHCIDTKFSYLVNVVTPNVDLYFNAWFDWTRDGDWDDIEKCADGMLAPEWAVQNQLLSDLPAGINTIDSLPFRPWHPSTYAGQKIWMRITLSERPWSASSFASVPGSGGSGPLVGYQYGETEDYYFRPRYPLISDINGNGVVDFFDWSIFANEWLLTGPR
ncbi:MAG: hypothetical protein JSU94_06255 [Phycisphaerales bacterium]|nr:MAG: hypothetical protein JSU94_06255 [Phycisphaerales bacterium]